MTYDRNTEIARYVECYADPEYAMGSGRLQRARDVLATLKPGRLLDVGAGRAELRGVVEPMGFIYVGTDPATGADEINFKYEDYRLWGDPATNLTWFDNSFDVVCCLDVLEHLIPEDVEPALREMDRVCKGTLFLTANSDPSIGPDGKDLHISKRPEAEWHQLFVEVFVGKIVKPIGMVGVSPGWLIS
jgi:SAM-dependent methyltransferase